MNNSTILKNVSIDEYKQVSDLIHFIKLVCFHYSSSPNELLKTKYYELLSNLPIYYPNSNFTKEYLYLLDSNPIKSFLDNKMDLLHWIHFIENQLLKKYGKQTQNFNSWLDEYNSRYCKPFHYDTENNTHFLYNEYIIYGLILICLISIIKYNM